jgi:LacI family transcriptional regulator, gluconate utilization system Gnt-I transcriptional repressor
MADVAAFAGVSKMTVSRALARAPDEDKATAHGRAVRRRILAACEKLGYVLDRTAGTFSAGRSGFVAVLIPTLNNSNFSETVQGLTSAVQDHGLQLLLGATQFRIEAEERLIEAMLSRRPEGVVLTSGTHTTRARTLLGAAGIPVIETWELPRRPIDHVVGFSNAAASALVVRHLHERGRRRIAFIGGVSTLDPRGVDRRRGYLRAVRELGLAEVPTIDCGSPPVSMQQGAEAMGRLLQQSPDIDAVCCVSDPCAFGALTECQRRGIEVPRQIAVAGFGNFEVGRGSYPSLTSVAIDCSALGRLTGELLVRAIAAQRVNAPLERERIVVPFTLLPREST